MRRLLITLNSSGDMAKPRRPQRTYGKKKSVAGKTVTGSLFPAVSNGEPVVVEQPHPVDQFVAAGQSVTTIPTVAVDAAATTPSSASRPSPAAPIPIRSALDDVTTAFRNANLRSDRESTKSSSTGSSAEERRQAAKEAAKSKRRESASGNGQRHQPRRAPEPAGADTTPNADVWLSPLVDAYSRGGRKKLEIQKWDDLVRPDWAITKIAEASFAEVYRVVNPAGDSILKIISLLPPSGPGSRRKTSATAESVCSELEVMNLMTDIYGFVEFKDAHLLRGRPSIAITNAYSAHLRENKTSEFPVPSLYDKEQVFLVLELGDAGLDLEHFEIHDVEELWDIFLGTAEALAHGETLHKFEVGPFFCKFLLYLTWPSSTETFTKGMSV